LRKILVTGGAGFIGTHLVKSLLKNGEEVIIFDNFSNSSKKKLAFLDTEAGKISIIEGDILDSELLESSLKDVDIVIHLAAKRGVFESALNPLEFAKVNVIGTNNLLNACIKNGIKNVIVASTSAVYGELGNRLLTEKSETNTQTPYAESKLSMEKFVQIFANAFKMNCIVLRIFNVYGQGASDSLGGAISTFIKNIKNRKPITLFDNGLHTRDFVSVEDIVGAINCSIENVKEKRGTVYNIASGKFVMIKDLVELMIKISGKKTKIHFSKSRKNEIKNSKADIVLAKKELNYYPKIQLEKELENLLKE